jgi:putative Holliday junction resolvase
VSDRGGRSRYARGAGENGAGSAGESGASGKSGASDGAVVEGAVYGGGSRKPAAGRVAALDLGARRIGVAYSDSRRTLASPWGNVARSGDPTLDLSAVVDVLNEIEARAVVVGLPLSLSGASGPAAKAAQEEITALRARLEPMGIAVETADERFTTVEAQRSLTAAGRKGRAARSVIDSAAAMVLLQAWLDKASRA